MGGGRASILRKKLRYERGFVYQVTTSNESLSDSGAFNIKTSTNKKDLNETLSIILSEISSIKRKGFNKSQLVFAKNKISKSYKRTMQTSGSWVDFHSLGELIDPENYLKLNEYVDKIVKIDNKKIIEAANKYFKPNSWYLVASGDISKSDIEIDF